VGSEALRSFAFISSTVQAVKNYRPGVRPNGMGSGIANRHRRHNYLGLSSCPRTRTAALACRGRPEGDRRGVRTAPDFDGGGIWHFSFRPFILNRA
jgi:hypothetical protein